MMPFDDFAADGQADSRTGILGPGVQSLKDDKDSLQKNQADRPSDGPLGTEVKQSNIYTP